MNREELAWAAGLFDGEGSSFVQYAHWNGVRYPTPRVGVAQSSSPEVLERFNRAVRGIGTLLGPFDYGHKPRWDIKAQGIEKAQAVMCMLWPWLSSIKREQYKTVMKTVILHRDTYKPARSRGAPGHRPDCICPAHRKRVKG